MSLIRMFWISALFFLDASLVCSSENSTKGCEIDGQNIRDGEVYFRVIPASGDAFCVACVCPISPKTCESRFCNKEFDKICKNGSSNIDSECCQRCSDYHKATVNRIAILSSNSTNDTKQVSCIHNGRLYNDGQSFPSHTDSRSRKPNQCVQCVCKVNSLKLGVVECQLKTCSVQHCPLNATKPSADEDCCISQVSCRDQFKPKTVDSLQPSELFIGDQDTEEEDFYPSFVFASQEKPRSNSKGKSRCKSGRRFFPNGATWNPILGPFGVMDCVTCKCVDSEIECSRMQCPPAEKLGCAQPKRVTGQCCPSCSSTLQSTSTMCSEQACSNIQVYKYTNLVRLTGAKSYQYAFVENGTTKDVFIYSWRFNQGLIENLSVQLIPKQLWIGLQQRFHFELIGATKPKYKQRFVKRVNRLSKVCRKNCEQKFPKLERVLKLKGIK